jgi:hypothetical protein
MDRMVERPGALDVHKAQVTACVRAPGFCSQVTSSTFAPRSGVPTV